MNGKRPRVSLHTRNWQEAIDRLQQSNVAGRIVAAGTCSVDDAIESYLADCRARSLVKGTVVTYRAFLSSLSEYAKAQGIVHMGQFTTTNLDQFRFGWTCASTTAKVNVIILHALFKHALSRGWISADPSAAIKAGDAKREETLPYTKEEQQAILIVLDKMIAEAKAARTKNHLIRLRALCLFMRYSGLRSTDAVMVNVDRINGRQLFLRAKKNGAPITVTLPQAMIDELDRVPRFAPNYWFSSGKREHNPAGDYRETFQEVQRLAKIKTQHHSFHRFRDTFAVEMLNRGVQIENVSEMLGHRNIKTTMDHYLPFVASRQAKLNEQVEAAHKGDELLALLNQPAKLVRVK